MIIVKAMTNSECNSISGGKGRVVGARDIRKGDIIGCQIDLGIPEIRFSVNGNRMEACFKNFNTDGYFSPVMSLSARVRSVHTSKFFIDIFETRQYNTLWMICLSLLAALLTPVHWLNKWIIMVALQLSLHFRWHSGQTAIRPSIGLQRARWGDLRQDGDRRMLLVRRSAQERLLRPVHSASGKERTSVRILQLWGCLRLLQGTEPFVPAAVDISQVTLAHFAHEIHHKLAENLHELWAMRKIELGWTYGEVCLQLSWKWN